MASTKRLLKKKDRLIRSMRERDQAFFERQDRKRPERRKELKAKRTITRARIFKIDLELEKRFAFDPTRRTRQSAAPRSRRGTDRVFFG